MAAKEDELDMTPTRLMHDSGGIVNVPAYKAERLLKDGSFSEVSEKKAVPAKKAAAKKAVPAKAAESSEGDA